jgi:5-methylcytosine-specific restriction enzyme subunit McrC
VIKRSDDTGTAIVARDCSPIPVSSREEADWLRRLVAAAKPTDMLLRLGHQGDEPDDEPVASFDAASGIWWAGRYVGEVQFEGQTLRLEPRFGMPALMRWLTTIWGVRLVDSKGRYKQQRIWLWLVIAHLWAGRLIAAAKHGLPYRRMETIHNGRTLRGRLLARETALSRRLGDERLASVTRARVVDPIIGGILLAAFKRLGEALVASGDGNRWLPERGKTLVDDLHSALGPRPNFTGGCSTIRYSPITENYRPVVDLSLSILAHRPRMATTGGESKAFSVLLDMAEIWELYVAKMLQIGLPGLRVSHSGRSTEHFRWLLSSTANGERFGSLRPDIIIQDHQERCLAVADAKYKTTRINADNRTGVVREDLYQLAAYLSGFGGPGSRLDGFLIYPEDDSGEVVRRLSPNNPWRVSSEPERNLWFISANCAEYMDATTMSAGERLVTNLVQAGIVRSPLH